MTTLGTGTGRRLLPLVSAVISSAFINVYPFLGPTLLHKIKDAVPKCNDQIWAFDEVTASIPPESVAEWTTMVECWEADNTQVNPFVITMKSKFSAYMVKCIH